MSAPCVSSACSPLAMNAMHSSTAMAAANSGPNMATPPLSGRSGTSAPPMYATTNR